MGISSRVKFARHPQSTATSEFRGSTTTLRDAAGAEGDGVLRIAYSGLGPFSSTSSKLMVFISLLKVLICIIH